MGAGIFPDRLHKILEDCEASGNQHIISWLPCGKYFKVHDSKEFSKLIMPKYFRHSRYKSFLRSLSMYKFQRVSKGPCSGAYGHPHFLRGRLDLCRYINRHEQVALAEPQRPILKEFSKPNEESNDASPSFNRSTIEVDDCRGDKNYLSLDDFNIDCKMSPVMEPTRDDPSWSLFNNTPPEIIDEIIATFAQQPLTGF
jgi:hypothetical protein